MNIEKITIRKKVTSRGGGIEIDLTSLGFDGERMAAYQNYLGGGMLGRVMVNDTIRNTNNVRKQLMYSSEFDKLDEIGEQLKKYYFNLTNPYECEWEHQSFEQNQGLSGSVY